MLEKNKKIIFSGGGTGGTVTPLLAVANELQRSNDFDLLFVGTYFGPEKELIEKDGFKFVGISSGKLRRYFSWHNFGDIFKIIKAFFQSWSLLKKENPSLVISAGAFVSVPLVLAAYLRRIPVMIHQQDVRAGLANKLMAPFAKVITVTFEKSLRDYGKKAIWIGNPSESLGNFDRVDILNKLKAKYNLEANLPIVLIVGGGTGALSINNYVESGISDLCNFCQVFHISGKNKKNAVMHHRYHQFELLPHAELLNLQIISDLVVSRCGLGFLTELSALAKPSILIPMPHSHQEDNAAIFLAAEAARVLFEVDLNSEIFVSEIKQILSDKKLCDKYSWNIAKVMKGGATAAFVKIIKKQ